MVYFFFSSRRRHTRLTCDWSSDVCSSDLGQIDRAAIGLDELGIARQQRGAPAGGADPRGDLRHREPAVDHRSEERRVGKECRCRWSAHDIKKKMYPMSLLSLDTTCNMLNS